MPQWQGCPMDLSDVTSKFSDQGGKQKKMIMVGCVLWTLWLTRNKLVCRNKFISSPNTCVHRVLSFMQ